MPFLSVCFRDASGALDSRIGKACRHVRFQSRYKSNNRRRLALRALGLALLFGGVGGMAHAASPCDTGPRDAAQSNAKSLTAMVWSPFGRMETGWDIYEPQVAEELGTTCPGDSPGFAVALAAWQKKHERDATGIMDPATFAAMKSVWQLRRSFALTSRVACPPAPDEAGLALALPAESYDHKKIQLQSDALAAYRRMIGAARGELPALAANPPLLTIFSGYRSPAYDAARCLREKNCQGLTRAVCSAHRTGYAMDLYLGAAPGLAPDSTDDANRLYLSRTDAYRWLVHNAARFGFVNYAFEPWHWEWTGEMAGPPKPG